MGPGNPNINEVNKATRFPHNDPTKGGRKPSIKKQLKELAMADGLLTYPADKIDSINEDGSVTVKITGQEQVAAKLWEWAMSKKGNDSLKALQMIIEHIDGKPKQQVEATITDHSNDHDVDKLMEENKRLLAIIQDEEE